MLQYRNIAHNQNYKRIKHKIKNHYLESNINDENMSFVYTLSKLLSINEKNFIKAFNSFVGLPHRYEIFLRKKNVIFINDSKATSFVSTKYALLNSKNIYWILGGLPKKNDKINLSGIKKNIIKCYVVGKNIKFLQRQIQNNLKKTLIEIIKDVQLSNLKKSIILFSPAAASYDQFMNFEQRGEEFKKLSKQYARKFL